jgi:hypothetical protein
MASLKQRVLQTVILQYIRKHILSLLEEKPRKTRPDRLFTSPPQLVAS